MSQSIETETKTVSLLFAGEPQPFGGLSNEQELAKLCPPEFNKDNLWVIYASKIFFGGANITDWKWRSVKDEERQRQMVCLLGLLGSFDLSHEDKEAVAGWILSKILSEVPE